MTAGSGRWSRVANVGRLAVAKFLPAPDGCVRFSVRVQPRASTTELAGLHGDALKVRLTAPPVDGAANEALVIFLAKIFRVPRHDVRILAGESARSKLIEIRGVTERNVREAATR